VCVAGGGGGWGGGGGAWVLGSAVTNICKTAYKPKQTYGSPFLYTHSGILYTHHRHPLLAAGQDMSSVRVAPCSSCMGGTGAAVGTALAAVTATVAVMAT
jgi:hypothetical protein